MPAKRQTAAAKAAAHKKAKKEAAAAAKAAAKEAAPPQTPANPPQAPSDDEGGNTEDDSPEGPRMTTTQLLKIDFGLRPYSLLPRTVHGIKTLTFAYKDEQPASNPELTVWALMNALRNSTAGGQDAINKRKEPRLLDVRTKRSSKGLVATPYTLNFTGTQNCDAMLRHLYGTERDTAEQCDKCTKGNGALVGCVTSDNPTIKSCANCEWNRSGAACSLTQRGTKRKTAEAEGSDSEVDDINPYHLFDGIDRQTCIKLSMIFKAATDHKKGKKGNTPKK